MLDSSFLDWPFFEPRHRALAEKLELWCEQQLPVDHSDVDQACKNLVQSLGRAGILEHSGAVAGEKLDVRSLCLIRETLARHDALADFAFAMQGLGMGAVSLFGSPEQQQWLAKTRQGQAISAFALTEPASGSDVADISTQAVANKDGYLLSGEKTWISNGAIADVYTVFARTGEAPGAKGLSAFLVPANTPGLQITERLQTLAPHPLARLVFDQMQLPTTALIGRAGSGFGVSMAVLDVFRSTVGAAALGMARRALQEAGSRCGSRELFGAPLGALQMVQGHIADMALDIDASALLVYRAAWTKDQGVQRVSREAAMAKLHATEAAQRTIDAAVQLHGADGVRVGSVVEALYREIRALRIYEGASDVQKTIIAKHVLG